MINGPAEDQRLAPVCFGGDKATLWFLWTYSLIEPSGHKPQGKADGHLHGYTFAGGFGAEGPAPCPQADC